MTITDVTVLDAPGLSLEPMPAQAFPCGQTDGSVCPRASEGHRDNGVSGLIAR